MSEDEKERNKIKIALIYYDFSSFVENDYELLSRHAQVEKVNYRRVQDIPKVIAAVARSDVTFSWFAYGHAALGVLFSRLLGKRSIVIAGGDDVACEPEIGYGQFTLPWHKRMLT